MRLPDFLIIGAMKSGTTGLFFDLCRHPAIYMPDNKEPHALCSDDVLTELGKRQYAALYEGAATDQLVLDGSTGYTKLPDRTGVVERAVAVLPEHFRAIYIVREPISRIVSQHYHEYSFGLAGPNIDTAVRQHSRFVDYSRYAWQLRPWIEAIGRERIHVVFFEDYKTDRSAVVTRSCEFLNLDPAALTPPNEEEIFNAGEGKPVPSAMWKKVRNVDFYKRYVRPLVSPRMRHHLRKYFMRKAPERPAPPTPATIAWLTEQLAEDRAELASQWGPLPWRDQPLAERQGD